VKEIHFKDEIDDRETPMKDDSDENIKINIVDIDEDNIKKRKKRNWESMINKNLLLASMFLDEELFPEKKRGYHRTYRM